MSTLQAIEVGLREPFSPELIHFKPKNPRQNPKTKRWEYLALPYADKQIYEDRLNQLAFGAWSTPYTPPIVAGNKLVVPVTVVILGVAHTDYGEVFILSGPMGKGGTREEENSATEAYSQGFRRACSQFGLGSYLYLLHKLWLPYDPEARMPQPLTAGERIAWIEKLYMDAGLSPRQTRSHPIPALSEEKLAPSTVSPNTPVTSPLAAQPATQPQQPKPAVAADRVDITLLKYLCGALDSERMRKSCSYYRVNDLSELTPAQAMHLSDFIDAQKKKKKTAAQ